MQAIIYLVVFPSVYCKPVMTLRTESEYGIQNH